MSEQGVGDEPDGDQRPELFDSTGKWFAVARPLILEQPCHADELFTVAIRPACFPAHAGSVLAVVDKRLRAHHETAGRGGPDPHQPVAHVWHGSFKLRILLVELPPGEHHAWSDDSVPPHEDAERLP